MWSQMLLSTHAFLKSISNVSGKDIGPLIKQWVYLCLHYVALYTVGSNRGHILVLNDLYYLRTFLPCSLHMVTALTYGIRNGKT